MLHCDVWIGVGVWVVWVVSPMCTAVSTPVEVSVIFCCTFIACPGEAVIHLVKGYGNGVLEIGFDSR